MHIQLLCDLVLQHLKATAMVKGEGPLFIASIFSLKLIVINKLVEMVFSHSDVQSILLR